MAQKVNAEIVLLLGWAPAILMQFAHPLVAAGVTAHSTFLTRPDQRPRRLRQTLASMLALTFGTEAEVGRAARTINGIHDRVTGRLPEAVGVFPAGTEYSAHDPELLRWVHATLLDVFPRAYELYVGPLTAEEKERYCREAGGIAPLLGIPDNYLPASTAELRRYMDGMLASGRIAVGGQARILAPEILNPVLPPPLRLLRPLLQLPAIGLLPSFFREAYEFGWDARRERVLRLSARVSRGALSVTPTVARHWPVARRARAGTGTIGSDSCVPVGGPRSRLA